MVLTLEKREKEREEKREAEMEGRGQMQMSCMCQNLGKWNAHMLICSLLLGVVNWLVIVVINVLSYGLYLLQMLHLDHTF
jgi:hypothetical protein